jgi:hypothetical protein
VSDLPRWPIRGPVASSLMSDNESLDADAEAMNAELNRLRELVGPDEKSYVDLRLDALAARDAALGAEAELGSLKAYNLALEAEVTRLTRDFGWFRAKIVGSARRIQAGRPAVQRVVGRLSK